MQGGDLIFHYSEKVCLDFITSAESGQDNRKRFSSPNPKLFRTFGVTAGCKGDTVLERCGLRLEVCGCSLFRLQRPLAGGLNARSTLHTARNVFGLSTAEYRSGSLRCALRARASPFAGPRLRPPFIPVSVSEFYCLLSDTPCCDRTAETSAPLSTGQRVKIPPPAPELRKR